MGTVDAGSDFSGGLSSFDWSSTGRRRGPPPPVPRSCPWRLNGAD